LQTSPLPQTLFGKLPSAGGAIKTKSPEKEASASQLRANFHWQTFRYSLPDFIIPQKLLFATAFFYRAGIPVRAFELAFSVVNRCKSLKPAL